MKTHEYLFPIGMRCLCLTLDDFPFPISCTWVMGSWASAHVCLAGPTMDRARPRNFGPSPPALGTAWPLWCADAGPTPGVKLPPVFWKMTSRQTATKSGRQAAMVLHSGGRAGTYTTPMASEGGRNRLAPVAPSAWSAWRLLTWLNSGVRPPAGAVGRGSFVRSRLPRAFTTLCAAREAGCRKQGAIRSGRDATRQHWAGLCRRRPPRALAWGVGPRSKQHVPPAEAASRRRAPLFVSPRRPARPRSRPRTDRRRWPPQEIFTARHGENTRARARRESASRTTARQTVRFRARRAAGLVPGCARRATNARASAGRRLQVPGHLERAQGGGMRAAPCGLGMAGHGCG